MNEIMAQACVKVKCTRTKPQICGYTWFYAPKSAERQQMLLDLKDRPQLAKMIHLSCAKCRTPMSLFRAMEAAKVE